MRKLHFYAFSFRGERQLHNGVQSITGSAYIGYPNQLVTVPRIKKAKEVAGVDSDAVLIGLGYMGYMTLQQCKGKQQ